MTRTTYLGDILRCKVFLSFVLAVLVYPAACSSVQASRESEISYRIRPGDTLASIGKRFGSNVSELQRKNGIPNVRNLRVGQSIRIPVRRVSGGNFSRVSSSVSRRNRVAPQPLPKVELGVAAKYLGNMTWPVDDRVVTSPFGWRGRSFHEGLDIGAPIGTPAYAAHSGKVVYSGNGFNGYGNVVIIKGDGLASIYGHASKIYVEEGDFVEAGDHIVDVGMSGRASGPHLHFETRIHTNSEKYVAIDPRVFF